MSKSRPDRKGNPTVALSVIVFVHRDCEFITCANDDRAIDRGYDLDGLKLFKIPEP